MYVTWLASKQIIMIYILTLASLRAGLSLTLKRMELIGQRYMAAACNLHKTNHCSFSTRILVAHRNLIWIDVPPSY